MSAGCCIALWLAGGNVSGQRGSALFNGQETLTGKIRQHDETLPPEVVRCVNCHGAGASNRIARVAAPHIDGDLLLEYHQRRGGPPSRYNQAAFCKLLRTGVDPAHIVIARAMPTYDVDDDQCASLWSFLLEKNAEATSGAQK